MGRKPAPHGLVATVLCVAYDRMRRCGTIYGIPAGRPDPVRQARRIEELGYSTLDSIPTMSPR